MDQNSHTVTRIEVLSRDLMTQLQKKPANHLVSAYNQIMQEMRNAFEQADANDISLQKALDMAKHQAIHIGEVTAEEAHEIGEYIKRDINDAAEYMMETSSEFYNWLMLDIEIIERRVIDLFLSVADHTRVELEQFNRPPVDSEPNQIPLYKSGEITGPGTLICEQCGAVKAFPSSAAITDCEQCGHGRFIRGHQGKR
ncbi:hypothetical protein MNBD_GAMMA05-2315 [hydrothermal vent metagenome]|uniref:Uncharacterized protein n=1 Tax=hydrothermal vent metagenome TaxID=652676 RepID=A0A3B0WGV9_9ZZZZ